MIFTCKVVSFSIWKQFSSVRELGQKPVNVKGHLLVGAHF